MINLIYSTFISQNFSVTKSSFLCIGDYLSPLGPSIDPWVKLNLLSNQFCLVLRDKGRGFYYVSPQSLIIMFSYSLALGTWLNFDCLVHKVKSPNVLTTDCSILIWCIIINGVHQFIGHCLIPLDPWFF